MPFQGAHSFLKKVLRFSAHFERETGRRGGVKSEENFLTSCTSLPESPCRKSCGWQWKTRAGVRAFAFSRVQKETVFRVWKTCWSRSRKAYDAGCKAISTTTPQYELLQTTALVTKTIHIQCRRVSWNGFIEFRSVEHFSHMGAWAATKNQLRWLPIHLQQWIDEQCDSWLAASFQRFPLRTESTSRATVLTKASRSRHLLISAVLLGPTLTSPAQGCRSPIIVSHCIEHNFRTTPASHKKLSAFGMTTQGKIYASVITQHQIHWRTPPPSKLLNSWLLDINFYKFKIGSYFAIFISRNCSQYQWVYK